MRAKRAVEFDHSPINARYRQKINELAQRWNELSRSEAEQQFLFYYRQTAERLNTEAPSPLLRRAAWHRVIDGPRAAICCPEAGL